MTLIPRLEVDTAAIYLAGVKNCTLSVHKFSRASCYELNNFGPL
jgi:hypothetical protein